MITNYHRREVLKLSRQRYKQTKIADLVGVSLGTVRQIVREANGGTPPGRPRIFAATAPPKPKPKPAPPDAVKELLEEGYSRELIEANFGEVL